jgi:hypothetical protein
MKKGNLTREQAVAIVGEAAVAAAEAESCEQTNRVGYNGACQGDAEIEWSASASAKDQDGTDCTVTAYYYTSQEEIDAAGDDLSNVDWVIAGYEVV